MNSTQWNKFIPQLCTKGTIVTWDLPGLGSSTASQTNDYSLTMLAKNLKRVIDSMAQKNIILVGHSIQAMIILTFCRLYPTYLQKRVQKISLINATYTKPDHTTIFPRLTQAIEVPLITPLCYVTIALSPVARVMNLLNYQSGLLHLMNAITGFAGHESAEELDFVTRFNIDSNPAVVARGILAMMAFDESKTISNIPIPTQVICSSDDKVTIPQASVTMDQLIPDSRLVSIHAGHMSIVERSHALILSLISFICSTSNIHMNVLNRNAKPSVYTRV